MAKHKNDNKPNEQSQVKIIVGSIDKINDPRMLEFLPPEIKEALLKELNGGGGEAKQEKEQEEPKKAKEKIKFDFDMVNCNTDLKALFTKLINSKHKDYCILLYGQPGSGKSYAAQYLAQELGMTFIKKRASDLIDKWIGATERNIQAAFQEAKKKKGILVLDEADSFLFDRRKAERDFECASTNELLTQMEDHPYPFICTTNLKEKLDKASFRRFLFKIRFDYMTDKNIIAGVKTYFGKQFKLTKEQLAKLKYITAGDFKIAKRKMEVLEDGQYTNDKIYEYLLAEQEEKDIKISEQISL